MKKRCTHSADLVEPLKPARRPAIGLALPFLLLACATGKSGEVKIYRAEIDAPAERIVLITIDTLRADYVGSYASVGSSGSGARTRNLDELAKRGARFATAIAPTPLTLPSHTTLLTGLDPPQHGVHSNGTFELDSSIPTLAEQLQGAGFKTAAILAAAVLDRRYGLARGFDHYDDEMGFGRTTPGSGGVAERRANEVIDRAIAWLDKAPDRFFLWVHLYDPHANYEPPPGFAKPLPRKPPDPRRVGFLKAARVALPPLYAGEIYYTDTELGRLLRNIDQRWSDGRTLFVVTSDHGESLGEHNEITHSLGVYDATQHVPLILAGPRVPSGRVVEASVRLADVAPTVLAIADAPPLPGALGVDLSPWLRGERSDPLEAYVETLSTHLDYGWSPIFGLRTDRFKYLRTTRPELYDLDADRLELHDLAAAQPAEVAALDARLEARLAGARPVVMRSLPTSDERAQLESLGYVVPSEAKLQPPLGEISGLDPKDERGSLVKLLEARSYIAAGEIDRAAATLARAGEAGGWIAQVKAEVAMLRSQFTEAESEARVMIDHQPAYAEGYMILGRALEAQQRFDEARAVYERATRIDESQSDSTVALGRLAEQEGAPDIAVSHYMAALATRAPHVDAALRLAAVHLDAGRSDAADELLEDIDDLSRATPDAVIRLARSEAAAGRVTHALARVALAARSSATPEAYLAIRDELAALNP